MPSMAHDRAGIHRFDSHGGTAPSALRRFADKKRYKYDYTPGGPGCICLPLPLASQVVLAVAAQMARRRAAGRREVWREVGGYVPPAAEMHAAIVGLYKLAQEIIGLSEKTGRAVPEEYITLMEWCKSELGDEV